MNECELYTRIIQTTHALIVVLDHEGRIVQFNQSCERLSGYSLDEVKGRCVWDFLLLPEETAAVRAVFENLRQGRFPNQFENHWVTRSGGRRYIEWSNSALTDHAGNVEYVIGTGIDVTRKREAEAQLCDTREQLQLVTSSVPLVLWIWETQSRRVPYVSPEFERVWGRSVPDPGAALDVFLGSIHPDDRQAMISQLQQEASGAKPGDSEYRIIRPGGEVRWIHSRAFPMKDQDGKVSRIVGYAEDVTARRATEQTLRETRQHHLALLDSIPDVAWLKDADGRYIEVNRSFRERWGIASPEIAGKTDAEIFPADLAEEFIATDRTVFASGQRLCYERKVPVRGEERWVDVTKVPVTDSAGKVIAIAGIWRDVSERKLAEARRITHDAVLRTALVKEVHHRIKNSLQGIITLLQHVGTEVSGGQDVQELVIARINAMAAMHGLQGATDQQELEIGKIVLTLVTSLRGLEPNRSLRLSMQSEPLTAYVKENEVVPLALIVNELIMNAIKHSPGGGNKAVEVALANSEDCVRIIVRNPSGRLPLGFDFDASMGIGTGLSLVKSLLPPEGAMLRFQDETGDGAHAELTLRPPVIERSSRLKEPPVTPESLEASQP